MDRRERSLAEVEGQLVRLVRQLRSAGRADLSLAQLTLLGHLDEREGLSMTEIAARMGVTVAGATGLVDRLERDGLVVRTRHDRDRRLVLVRLTAEGRAALGAARRRKSALLRELAASLDDDELATLAALLARLAGEARSAPPLRAE